MDRQKLGTGYWRNAGNYKPRAVIWLINGYAYAKDQAGWRIDALPLEGELSGYVRVNGSVSPVGNLQFHQATFLNKSIRAHQRYTLQLVWKPSTKAYVVRQMKGDA